MPKNDYRIPTRRERELFSQVRDLQRRIDALSADPSATLEIDLLKERIIEGDAACAALEERLASEQAKAARLRGELDAARAKRREAEAIAKKTKGELADERRKTQALQRRIDDACGYRARILEENRSLKERLESLEAELARRQVLIEHLNARLSRGPENSSVPPSAEPNKKRIPNSRAKSNRRPGGQPNHKGHARTRYEPDEHVFLGKEGACCASCGCETHPTGATRQHTVTDVEVRTRTVAYISSERACPACGKRSWDAFPKAAANESNYGPGVKSAIAYLTGACNVSGANARGLIRELTGGAVNVSSGSVANFARQFSELAEGDLQVAFDEVATSPVIGSDATFTRAEGATSYIYVFHADDAAVFSANHSKGHAALKASPVADAPAATLVHDHDTSYYSYGGAHAECNVHILRYLKGVAENEPGRFWADDMAKLLVEAKDEAARARAENRELEPAYVRQVERSYREILDGAIEGYARSGAVRSKYPPEGVRLARRMRKFAKNHLLFLHDLSVPFDNNKSERLLRQAKKKLKQSGCWRSTENGEQLYCDFLTIVETAKMRNIPPMQAVRKIFEGEGGLFEQ